MTGCLFFLRKVTFEKQWFYLDNAIGHSYGSAFDVSSGGSLQLRKKLEEPAPGTRRGWDGAGRLPFNLHTFQET